MATFARDCLADKAILITGGLGAIGRIVVSRLVEHSAKVTVNDLLADDEAKTIIRAVGWPADHLFYVRADVTKPDQAHLVVARTIEHFGQLDVAFCHAGMAHTCAIVDYPEQEWDRIQAVNLKSAFLVAQA